MYLFTRLWHRSNINAYHINGKANVRARFLHIFAYLSDFMKRHILSRINRVAL